MLWREESEIQQSQNWGIEYKSRRKRATSDGSDYCEMKGKKKDLNSKRMNRRNHNFRSINNT